MSYAITYEGIENVMANLDYSNPGTLKYKYIHAIKSRYSPDTDIMSVKRADQDLLIRKLWDISDDPEAVRSKRKNLNTIRSTVNADLKKLFEKGENPEGITISPDHTFAMSDDAKNEMLNAFAHSIKAGANLDLLQIADVMNLIGEFIEKNSGGLHDAVSTDVLENIKKILKALNENSVGDVADEKEGQKTEDSLELGNGPGSPQASDEIGGASLDSVDDEELEEVDDDQVDIVDDDELEEIDDDQVDIVDDEELEEIDDDQVDIVDDEELEEIDDDQVDIVDDEELEEIDDDQVDIVDDEELEEIDDDQVDIVDDEELEEIDDDQIDIVDDEELEEIDDDQVDIVDDEELEEIDDDQVDIVDDEELEEIDDDQVDIVDDEELEETDDDQVDIVDDDELEEVDDDQVDIVDDEELEEVDDDQVDIVDDEELEEVDDDQVDIVDDEELEEVDDDQVDIVDDEELEEIEDDQVDIVDDEELEEVKDDQIDIVDDEELEEVDDDQVDIVDDEELEEIDDDQVDIVDEEELEEVDDDQVDIVDDDELEEIDDDQVDIVDDDELEEIDDDQVDIVDDEELEEIDDDEADYGTESDTGDYQGQSEEDTGTNGSGSGLPDENHEHRIGKDEEKRRLSEQFTKELSAMDRYYNSYLKIPKGSYLIGSPQPEKHEMAEHHVELNDFFIGKFPVTNALFEVFTAKTGYRTTAEKKGYGTVYTGRFKKVTDKKTGQIRSVWNATFSYQIVKGACWYHPDGPESSIVNRLSHPVVQVSLEDAFAFAAWVGKTIPSENQWEASGRTDQGFIYPWGNAWSDQACNMEKSAIAGTSPVDRYLDFVNAYKIADLTGNVLEWTADYIPSPYSTQSDVQYAIAKGGSWVSSQPVALWSRFIFKDDYTSNTLGFRCVAR